MVKFVQTNTLPADETDSEEVHKLICKPKRQKVKKVVHKEVDLDNLLSEDTITSEDYFKQVHEFFKNKNKTNPQKKNRIKEYIYEKTCETCQQIQHDELLLLCDYCDDAYHTYCLKPKLKEVPEEDIWICPICIQQKTEKAIFEGIEEITQANFEAVCRKIDENERFSTSTIKKKRQTTLEEHYDSVKAEKDQIFDCKKCDREIKNVNEREFCTRCTCHFHKNCFPKKKNAILCKECVTLIKKSIPAKNANILKYFSTKTLTNSDKNPLKNLSKSRSKSKKRTLLNLKNKKTFKLPKYFINSPQEIEMKHTLLFALKAKGIDFDDNLRYSNKSCNSDKNQANLEQNLQKMDQQTLKIFKEFKKMSKEANYVPVLIEPDKTQGFFVRAFEDIQEMTLIAEYVGDVDFARNRIFDKNDSIMDLLRTTRSKTSLVICPEKYGNLARFLSGINNSEKGAKKKQNVQSVRFNVEGQARVILYAKRNIKKGEILCYDYNEGCFDEYPTENFV